MVWDCPRVVTPASMISAMISAAKARYRRGDAPGRCSLARGSAHWGAREHTISASLCICINLPRRRSHLGSTHFHRSNVQQCGYLLQLGAEVAQARSAVVSGPMTVPLLHESTYTKRKAVSRICVADLKDRSRFGSSFGVEQQKAALAVLHYGKDGHRPAA